MDTDTLKSISDSLRNLDYSKLVTPGNLYPKIELPDLSDLKPIDLEDTVVGDIKRKIEEQNLLVSQEINVLIEQNKLLSDNYSKLKEMYDVQAEAFSATREDLEKSRGYNMKMMIISIIAMLAAVAAPIVTILVS